MSSSSASPLQTLRARLAIKADETFAHKYLVPGRWLSTQNAPAAVAINPYQVWLNTIDWILKQPVTEWVQSAEATPGSWSRHAVVYNLFVRSATAFDHDGDGVLGRPNNAGMNEVGTFVKSLMLLRYIKQLGCNTIHLLPITAVGQDGSKGDMGSPYAIRNPYRLDENLAEPGLDLGVETEFAAFVEAAHHLGLRVVVEFVFRTSSKDGDWVVAIFPKLFEQVADWLSVQPRTGVLDLGSAGFRGFEASADPLGRVHNLRFVHGGHGAGIDITDKAKLAAIVDYLVSGRLDRVRVFEDANEWVGWVDVASNVSWLVWIGLAALLLLLVSLAFMLHRFAGIAAVLLVLGALMSV